MTRSSGAAGRTPRLSRERIVAAVVDLLESGGVAAVTTRTVGEALQVHPTALYRHFRDMDDLIREAADHVLDGVTEGESMGVTDPLEAVHLLCLRLRATLMTHPGTASGVASGPSRKLHERVLTERMLDLLVRSGLSDEDAVLGYHALVEYTVGSAVIDAPGQNTDPDEESRHRAWRADYLTAPQDEFPVTVRLASLLYPSQDDQFRFGLRLLVDGLRSKAAPGDARAEGL